MLPDTGRGGQETSGGVPLNVGYTVVIGGGEKLEVGGEVLVLLISVALKVKVVEVEVVRLLAENGGNDHETTSG